MRFASKYGRMIVQIQPLITEDYATGGQKTLQNALYARFEPGGLEPFEREVVLAQWSFQGSYQELDEVTTVPPDYRIGVFDSVLAQQQHGWTDETRQKVEQGLIDVQKLNEILALPKTTVPAPWPLYDEFKGTVRQLLKKLEEDGHDLYAVLTYERASQNRPALVDALQSKLDGFDVEEARQEEEVLA